MAHASGCARFRSPVREILVYMWEFPTLLLNAATKIRMNFGRISMAGFDVSGSWNLHQSNGADVAMNVGRGPSPDGTATHDGINGHFNQAELTEHEFHFVIRWDNGPIGDYVGTFGIDGRLRGQTFDATNPHTQALWHSEKQFRRV
jgi:hypothetical protein